MATRNLLVRAGFDASGMRRGLQQCTRYLGGFSKIGKMLAGAFAIGSLVNFGKQCVELGSNLAEVQNVVDVTFGSMAKEINEFAKTSIESMGISETACKKYSSTMGAMLKSMGITGQPMLEMSKNLTKLSADMASFYNLSSDEAFAKIRSGISGETEPLKQLGINMSVANMEAFALSKGIKKSWQSMTQAEQALLRYNYLLSVTTDAQGDFERTSDSWANQTRILNEQFNALKATLGQALIQMLTPVIKMLNQLISKLQTVANYLNEFTAAAFGRQKTGAGVANVASDFEDASSSAEEFGDTTEEAMKKATKSILGFDEVNTLNQADAVDDTPIEPIVPDDVNIDEIPDTTNKTAEDVQKIKDAIDNIKDKMKPIADLSKELADNFLKRFLQGLQKADFVSILNGLSRIANVFREICADKGLQKAAKRTLVTFSQMLGSMYGNSIAAAANIIDGFVNGIADGLEAKKQVIIDRFTDMFNNLSRMNISLSNIFDFLGDMSKVFSEDNARSIWSSITQTLIETCTMGLDLGTKIGADLVGAIENILISNSVGIYDALNNTLGVVAQLFDTVKNTISNTCETILNTYDSKVGPAIATLSEALANFAGCLLDIYNNTIAPVFSEVAEKIDECFSEYLQPAIDAAIDLLGQFAESVANVLAHWEPLFEFLSNVIIPYLAGGFKTVMNAVINIIEIIINLIKAIIRVLKGVLEFLEGVFTGNWEKAWEGIKDIFGGVWDGIESIAVGVFKTIKEWIDDTTDSANELKDTILETMGLKEKEDVSNNLEKYKGSITDSTINTIQHMNDEQRQRFIDSQESKGLLPPLAEEWIMSLPHYASGGLINREQIAMLGEGGKQEAVIPLEDSGVFEKIGIAVANAIGTSNTYNGGSKPLTVILEADMRELAKAVVPYIPEQSRRLGVSLK